MGRNEGKNMITKIETRAGVACLVGKHNGSLWVRPADSTHRAFWRRIKKLERENSNLRSAPAKEAKP